MELFWIILAVTTILVVWGVGFFYLGQTRAERSYETDMQTLAAERDDIKADATRTIKEWRNYAIDVCHELAVGPQTIDEVAQVTEPEDLKQSTYWEHGDPDKTGSWQVPLSAAGRVRADRHATAERMDAAERIVAAALVNVPKHATQENEQVPVP
jgi:hypothetical protein